MTSTILNNYELTYYTSMLFMATLTFVSSDLFDYDLPKNDEIDNYNKYHFRKSEYCDLIKLEPKHFFKSTFNPDYHKIPHPRLDLDFKVYTKRLTQRKYDFHKMIDLLKNNLPDDVLDPRYMFPSIYHTLKTDKKFYQSNILKYKREMIETYVNNWDSYSQDDYESIMMKYLYFPKFYEEDPQLFSNARLQAGVFMQKTTPGVSVVSIADLRPIPEDQFQFTSSKFLLKNDTYFTYSVRVVYYEKVPLHAYLSNKFNGTKFILSSLDITLKEAEEKQDRELNKIETSGT